MFDCLQEINKTSHLFPERDEIPVMPFEEFNLLVSKINHIRNFQLPILLESDSKFSERFFYANKFESFAINEIGDYYHYAHSLSAKLVSKKRIMELNLLVKFISAKLNDKIRSKIIFDLILLYLTIIVFIQDFPGKRKNSLAYKQKCDVIVDYLMGNKTIVELQESGKIIVNKHLISESNFLDVMSLNLLIEPLIEPLTQLTQKLAILQQQNLISQDLKQLFCQEFSKAIRTCHLPSIHTRSTLDGHLTEASSSCMLKPVFILLASSLDVTLAHLGTWEYCIEIVHLCMRFVNDFFSYEREKKSGNDYLRNLVHIIQNERINEFEARLIVVQLYNLLMAHYFAEKDKQLIKPEKDLFLILELVNDIPLFVWSQLASTVK